MSDSDDELMAALEAEMEDRSSGAVLSTGAGTGSSSSITSSDCSSKASASSSSMVQVEGINDEIANQIHAAEQWLEWEAAQSRPLERHQRRPPCRGGDDRCLIFELPEELQRRILRFVSIANLMSGVRFVSKHASGVALAEVRERIRGLLLDSLISGFETEMAPPGSSTAAAASSSSPPTAATTNCPTSSSFSITTTTTALMPGPAATSSSSGLMAPKSSSIDAAYAAAPPPTLLLPSAASAPLPYVISFSSSGDVAGESPPPAQAPVPPVAAARREHMPPRQRLVALASAVEFELTSLASSREPSDRVRTLTSKTRSICFNLSDAKNPELRSRLLCGELAPAQLVRLSSQEMASGSLRAQRDEWHAKRLKCAIRPERTLGYLTSIYKCEGCGSRSTRVHRTIRAGQKQVDRARTYVTCVECSRRWEEGGM